jgi:HEAT repeat protein
MLSVLGVALAVAACGRSEAERDDAAAKALLFQEGGFKTGNEKLAKEKGVDGLAKMLQSKSQVTRMAAISALAYFKNDAKATKLLVDILTAGKDPNDSYFALIALASQGAPQAKEMIEKHFRGDDAYVREAAVQAIGILGDKSLYPLLTKALSDPNPGVSTNAGYVIEKYKLEELRP